MENYFGLTVTGREGGLGKNGYNRVARQSYALSCELIEEAQLDE